MGLNRRITTTKNEATAVEVLCTNRVGRSVCVSMLRRLWCDKTLPGYVRTCSRFFRPRKKKGQTPVDKLVDTRGTALLLPLLLLQTDSPVRISPHAHAPTHPHGRRNGKSPNTPGEITTYTSLFLTTTPCSKQHTQRSRDSLRSRFYSSEGILVYLALPASGCVRLICVLSPRLPLGLSLKP